MEIGMVSPPIPSLFLFVSLLTTISSAHAIDCPPDASTASLDRFQLQAATQLANSSSSVATISEALRRCFPAQLPACLKRAESFVATRQTIPSSTFDSAAHAEERKQPPSILVTQRGESGTLTLADNIEQIAQEKNWPVVRYKSRHAGGFDRDTASLLMIRVPGDQLDPPVNYDRYLNFPLPADDSTETMNPLPSKSAALSPAELSQPGSFPSQFTVLTVSRATGEERSEVYFQKYGRSGTKWTPDSPASVANCYQCHPSGLRAISPLGYHVRKLETGETEPQLPPAEWTKVREMNHAMEVSANGKLADWRGSRRSGEFRSFLDVAGVGPLVGPTNPLTRVSIPRDGGTPLELPLTRQKEFILGGVLNGVNYPGCSKSRPVIEVRDIFGRLPGQNNVYRFSREPVIRWQAVRDAMNCASCHGNTARGGLNERITFAQIEFKILVDQSMPPGYHQNPMDRGNPNAPVQDRLNPDERIALTNCLKAEFEVHEKSKVKEWLTETACIGADGFMPSPKEWWKVR